MSMIKRGASGSIDKFTGEQNDGAILCMSCNKIIVSKENLEDGGVCPYCHRHVNSRINTGPLDDDGEGDVIAKSC